MSLEMLVSVNRVSAARPIGDGMMQRPPTTRPTVASLANVFPGTMSALLC